MFDSGLTPSAMIVILIPLEAPFGIFQMGPSNERRNWYFAPFGRRADKRLAFCSINTTSTQPGQLSAGITTQLVHVWRPKIIILFAMIGYVHEMMLDSPVWVMLLLSRTLQELKQALQSRWTPTYLHLTIQWMCMLDDIILTSVECWAILTTLVPSRIGQGWQIGNNDLVYLTDMLC